MNKPSSRRSFLKSVGLATSAVGLGGAALAQKKDQSTIPGFEKAKTDPNASKGWKPFSDRRIRVGIAGYGLCAFGAHFGFQNPPE